jgi:trehalose 6-phosphate synthase
MHFMRNLFAPRFIDRAQENPDNGHGQWTEARLRELLTREAQGAEIVVVANREPYIHVHTPDGIRIQRPASGLVTALEPVMRACAGTWIAHGSGTADRETVDRDDRIAVPPSDPRYRLRRVWLTPEEEAGYYAGFANEGLWPLCHIAHVRPTFRASDWQHYRKVNARFADAVAKEARTSDPIVLVQDYHYALLPRMIVERVRRATVVTFWHIPWPNPEAFAICPWRHELLDGLLGSTILGFHTQFHCNNFLDTADRLLEARVDRDTFSIAIGGRSTFVRRYPISIEWPPRELASAPSVDDARLAVRTRLGLPPRHALGVGIDRLDYTKGLEERIRAVERLLELHPRWIGRFTFAQIAAPSRWAIDDYRRYADRVRALAASINAKFASARHPPIVLIEQHHEVDAVYEYLRAADLCFVSSLHDGMNLVAKEFVAARDDDSGVLILSRFAGAARELAEALIVNPYDADECAGALHAALTMRADERRERMRLMRRYVSEFNVHRWAGRMLQDATAMRRRNRLWSRLPAADALV